MARLVAVGVPPRTLLAAQAVQVLLPLGAGVVLAAGCGLILVGAVAWSTGTGLGVIGAGVPLFLGVVAGVVTLVPLLTLPAATPRLAPELLREVCGACRAGAGGRHDTWPRHVATTGAQGARRLRGSRPWTSRPTPGRMST